MIYSEHEKLDKVKDKSQAIGEFMEWVKNHKHLMLARWHSHTDSCQGEYEGLLGKTRVGNICGFTEDSLELVYIPIENLLAEYFGIDTTKLEEEKRQMLAEIRSKQ